MIQTRYTAHNRFLEDLDNFHKIDPQLRALDQLKHKYNFKLSEKLSVKEPGIYILTGGRQIGKSTACKQLILQTLKKRQLDPQHIFYFPCDEIYDAKELGKIIRIFLEQSSGKNFLLILDEITFVKNWERTIKALADEGQFKSGACLLTGSDTVILKEAAMQFPGRRGNAAKTDFHLSPLCFSDYVTLITKNKNLNNHKLLALFEDYLICGGYLRAINDLAKHGKITDATFTTYEQWIRGDFIKRGKNESTLLSILQALLTISVSPISYSSLNQEIGTIAKETCIDYCRLLERMDILINLQAFDQNKKQGFPKKDRKFHLSDPFILHTVQRWLEQEGYISTPTPQSNLIEACVASHCHRTSKTYYFKGQGEIDVIWLTNNTYQALEVKWANQVRPNDLKMLKQFKKSLILTKNPNTGAVEDTKYLPVYQFLYETINSEL